MVSLEKKLFQNLIKVIKILKTALIFLQNPIILRSINEKLFDFLITFLLLSWKIVYIKKDI